MRYLNKINLINFLSSILYNLLNTVHLEQSSKDDEYFISLWREMQETKNTEFVEKITALFPSKKIPNEFIDELALKTQICDKASDPNWLHGYLLYALIGKIGNIVHDFTILDIGTARGFSSICMAKSLKDHGYKGKIITIDILPNEKKGYWNSIGDAQNRTRLELLSDYESLVEEYVIFLQGTSKLVLNLLSLPKIDFAFLDGSHYYEDVNFEIKWMINHMKKGGHVLFDDYSPQFPGVRRAFDEIRLKEELFESVILQSEANRGYGLLKLKN